MIREIRKNENGVTLLVLTIMVIIMLILGTTILYSIYNKEGLLNEADQEKFVAELQSAKQLIEVYLNEQKQGDSYSAYNMNFTGTELKTMLPGISADLVNVIEVKYGEFFYVSRNSELEQTQWAEDAGFKILENYKSEPVYIPDGFTKITYADSDVLNGFVITDSTNGVEGGNEYVWVPVFGEMSRIENNNVPAQSNYTKKVDTKDDAVDFRKSVEKYNGFYVARYEAGFPTTVYDSFNIYDYFPNTIPETKQGLIPWTNVTYDFAKNKSKEVMNDRADNITSEIINAYAWDTIMQWLQASGYDTDTDSTAWGNRFNSSFTLEGDYGRLVPLQGFKISNVKSSYYNKKANSTEKILCKTGASNVFKTNNIFDISGNASEWTSEYLRDDSSKHILRGGDFVTEGTVPADSRLHSPDLMLLNGFRFIIYKKSKEVKKDGSWDGNLNSPIVEGTGLTPVYYKNNKWVELTDASTESEWENWYNYENKRWANARSKDGSMWVWIPRYEYKINNQSIDIKFIQTKQIDSDSGYIINPAFTDGRANGFSEGEWDKEIPGFWVAKYQAGYQCGTLGEENKEVEYSEARYSENSSYTHNYVDMNFRIGAPISYPVFKANTFIYNHISAGDAFMLAKEVCKGDRFGLEKFDSHMLKNSEWGAVVYLTYSKYGTNGADVGMNSFLTDSDVYVLNDPSNGAYISCFPMTSYGTRGVPNDIEASSTKNMTGVFDLSGGAWEVTAGYRKGGKSGVTSLHYYLGTVNTIESTKYMTLYEETSDKKGDAIVETQGWNNTYYGYPALNAPVTRRGGPADNSDQVGIFSVRATSGFIDYIDSFRVCLIFK